MAEHAQYLTLVAAGEVFGAPVEKVQEILDVRPIARLPQMPDYLLGMIDVRGRTIPVVDLRRALGFDDVGDTPQTRIVVMSVGQITLGVRADRVFEVTRLDAAELEPPVAVGGSWTAHCLAGIGRRNGGFVTVLDFDRLLEHVEPLPA